MRRAGGAARIESRSSGGTTVRLILPTADFTPVHDAPAPARFPSPRDAAILLVDDDPDVRETLSNMLADLGATIHSAEDGASALSLLEEFEPDLLLVDFAMPGINGAELAKAARSTYPNLPVAFVTGFADSEAIETAAGPNPLILRKPFRDFELHAIIAKALQIGHGNARTDRWGV